MSHPTPEPDAAVIHRMHRTTAAVKDHPEVYTTTMLARLRGAAMELEQAADRELMARARL